MIVRLDGDAAMVKSGTGTEFTVNVTIVDCTGEPLASVAVIVTGNEPVVVAAVVVMFSVEEYAPLEKVAGENVPSAPLGRPVTENVPPPA